MNFDSSLFDDSIKKETDTEVKGRPVLSDVRRFSVSSGGTELSVENSGIVINGQPLGVGFNGQDLIPGVDDVFIISSPSDNVSTVFQEIHGVDYFSSDGTVGASDIFDVYSFFQPLSPSSFYATLHFKNGLLTDIG